MGIRLRLGKAVSATNDEQGSEEGKQHQLRMDYSPGFHNCYKQIISPRIFPELEEKALVHIYQLSGWQKLIINPVLSMPSQVHQGPVSWYKH